MRFQTKSCTSVCEQKGRCFRHIMSWFSPYRSTCVLYSKYNCWVSQKQQTSLRICIQLRGTVEAINTLTHLLVQIDFSLLKFPADPFTSWQSYWSFPLLNETHLWAWTRKETLSRLILQSRRKDKLKNSSLHREYIVPNKCSQVYFACTWLTVQRHRRQNQDSFWFVRKVVLPLISSSTDVRVSFSIKRNLSQLEYWKGWEPKHFLTSSTRRVIFHFRCWLSLEICWF